MTHLFIALTLFAWGIAGIFDKKAVQSSCPRSVFVAFHLFSLPVTIVLFFALPWIYGQWQISSGVVFWEGLNAFSALIAILTYFYAMSKTQASWVLGITAGYPIIGQLLAVPLLGEHCSAMALFAAVMVSVGVAAIGASGTEEQKQLSKKERIFLYLAVAASTFLWGLLGIFEKRSLEFGRPFEAYLMLSIWKVVLVLLAVLLFRMQSIKLHLQQFRTWQFSWLSAFLVMAGNVGFILALVKSPAGYLIVITACYPLVMYVFALFFLKERPNLMRITGIVITVLGAILAEVAH